MLVSVFLALFLPCAGMSAIFIVYICLLWFAAASDGGGGTPEAVKEEGLSGEELEKLPRIAGKELVLGTECAVCLDEIGDEQPATVVPGCNHGFHVECADAWLSKSSVCPVCRYRLHPQTLTASDQNPC